MDCFRATPMELHSPKYTLLRSLSHDGRHSRTYKLTLHKLIDDRASGDRQTVRADLFFFATALQPQPLATGPFGGERNWSHSIEY